MTKKKIKRVKKRNIFRLLVLILLFGIIIYYILTYRIKNIYITGNSIVSDNDIIKLADLENYPSFILTSKSNITSKLKENIYIKDVKVTKTYNFKLYLEIEEYKILGIDNANKLVLGDGSKIDNIDNATSVPLIINDIPSDIYSNFIKKFNLINTDVYYSISQIEYAPVNVDKERFLLYMNDDNYVYITLSKIKKINNYYDISRELEGKKGIIYLDSGDYIEVKA